VIDTATLARPRALTRGDRIAAVTLSWGGPGTFPHRYETGVRQLEAAFGVTVVPMPHALADPGWLAANPAARVDDLHRAFADPSIHGIVSTIGGDDSIRLMPLLDIDVVRDHPKVFLGFSDTTITHMACLRAGIVSFYGPSIMAGFGENGGLLPYMERGVRQMLFEPTQDILWPENAEGWTVEFLDWADPSNQDQPRTLRPCTGWRWLGGTDTAEGPLVAGCLEVLAWLPGSAWWPDLEGAILAVETSEEQPSPEIVRRFFRALALTGDLVKLSAILFGRPGGSALDPAEHGSYDDAILSVVRDEQGLERIPIVTGMDFGHTDPAWTLPIGVRSRVDPRTRTVRMLEPAIVSESVR
jgi:muramoyltetrapeptide carboxypeptidase LdcA involved in peptidoglycan recycling